MRSGATTSAGRAKKDWERCWEGLDGRGGYGSGVRIEPRPASAKIVRRKLLTICTGNPPFYQQQ